MDKENLTVPLNVNILLFQGFETLDVFGPVEIFGRLTDSYKLCYYSVPGGLIKSTQGAEINTKPTSEIVDGILLLPGGMGTRTLVQDEAFIQEIKGLAERSLYCLTVCTGSALLAKTGLLDGRRATSNKIAFAFAQSCSASVQWVYRARWVQDGPYYTSSGVSAGMDMSLGFIQDRHGTATAEDTAAHIEYIWNRNSAFDPFAKEE